MGINIYESKPLNGYFDSLDGLRAISIILVIINHFTVPLPYILDFIRARGHLGVEIFFAVSGFLVMRSLHICVYRNKDNLKSAIKEFYLRRASRIFFPYYAILIVIFLLSFV
ncbi:MAG: acyltransferase, partial [Bdellovibrionales bacterium]|nr:acyltransferase family protein [Bdellovibrionales bacterium]NQZ20099.1 acyltransferase [Bdellovibrionales bacterium]